MAKYQLERRASEEHKNYDPDLKPKGVFGVWYKEKPEENDPPRRQLGGDGPVHPFHASHHFSNY